MFLTEFFNAIEYIHQGYIHNLFEKYEQYLIFRIDHAYIIFVPYPSRQLRDKQMLSRLFDRKLMAYLYSMANCF